MSGVTGRIAYDASGNLMIYTPPTVTVVPAGDLTQVTYGDWQTLVAGDPLPGPGTYEITDGAGGLNAQNDVTYRTVMVTLLSRELP